MNYPKPILTGEDPAPYAARIIAGTSGGDAATARELLGALGIDQAVLAAARALPRGARWENLPPPTTRHPTSGAAADPTAAASPSCPRRLEPTMTVDLTPYEHTDDTDDVQLQPLGRYVPGRDADMSAYPLHAAEPNDQDSRQDQDGGQVEELIRRALACQSHTVRDAAAAAEQAIDALRQLLAEHEREAAELAAAREQAAAEVARLEAALAEARERARTLAGDAAPARRRAAAAREGVPAGCAPGQYDPQVVRAWAAAAEVECPAYGRVPVKVVQAWRNAMQGQRRTA